MHVDKVFPWSFIFFASFKNRFTIINFIKGEISLKAIKKKYVSQVSLTHFKLWGLLPWRTLEAFQATGVYCQMSHRHLGSNKWNNPNLWILEYQNPQINTCTTNNSIILTGTGCLWTTHFTPGPQDLLENDPFKVNAMTPFYSCQLDPWIQALKHLHLN